MQHISDYSAYKFYISPFSSSLLFLGGRGRRFVVVVVFVSVEVRGLPRIHLRLSCLHGKQAHLLTELCHQKYFHKLCFSGQKLSRIFPVLKRGRLQGGHAHCKTKDGRGWQRPLYLGTTTLAFPPLFFPPWPPDSSLPLHMARFPVVDSLGTVLLHHETSQGALYPLPLQKALLTPVPPENVSHWAQAGLAVSTLPPSPLPIILHRC